MKGTLHLPTQDPFCMIYSVGPKKGTPREEYRVSKRDIATMKQQVVAFRGKYVVVAEADQFYGGLQSKDYQSEVLIDPTWGRLFACAKAAQKKTLDLHHTFFEGAYVRKQGTRPDTMDVNGEKVTILDLSLGS